MDIIRQVRQELEESADSSTSQYSGAFFKEHVKSFGVTVPTVTKIAERLFKQIKHLSKDAIFGFCEELQKSGYVEEAFVAYRWSDSLHDRYEPEDFAVFEHWLGTYVSNWAECDTLCNHTVGTFVEKYPEYVERLKGWTQSQNRWVRRGAAVTLVLPARRGHFLVDVLEIADKLLMDKDDLVQKGYGWMLKEASKKHQQEVFGYVMKHKSVMPRTALRYAIEKMPPELRKEAMKK
jgi:3-methyladenine DNA glycosylase AlkD